MDSVTDLLETFYRENTNTKLGGMPWKLSSKQLMIKVIVSE